MQNFKLLGDALDYAAQHQGNIGYIEKQGQELNLSYTELRSSALEVLGALQNTGVQQGDQVVLFINNNPLFIRVFWACVLGGFIPVPVAVGISSEHKAKLAKIVAKLSSPWLLVEDAEKIKSADANDALIQPNRVLTPDLVDQSNTAGVVANDLSADDTALIQFSSGSTSDPKGVVLTHKNLLTNINGIIQAAELTENEVSLSWMPLTHDMGLIGFHLTMVVRGVDQYLMPTELFSRRPLLWIEKASEKKATILCSPNFGYKHYLRALGDKEPDIDNLDSLRLVFNGAEPISTTLIEQFMGRLAPYGLIPESMCTVYGLAEASLAVTFPAPDKMWQAVCVDRESLGVGDKVNYLDKSHEQSLNFVSEGFPVSGCKLRITNNDNQVLADDYVGLIQISGDNVTAGYYEDEQSNATSMTDDGWVDTGDLGFMTEHGLVVTGRNKEIIFSQGLNYYPHDLEAVLIDKNVSELGKVVAAGYRPAEAEEDEIIIFILFRKATEDFLETVSQSNRIINEQIGLEVTHVIPVRRIPKTTSGKVQRRLLLNDYIAGEYSEYLSQYDALTNQVDVDDAQLSPVEKQLQAIVHEVIPDKSFALDTNFFDAGISSLALAEIHQKIDDQWPGKIDVVDLFDHQTIAEVASFIEKQTG